MPYSRFLAKTKIALILILLPAMCWGADCKKALFGWDASDGTHIAGTLANEGGWVKNPADSGGETYQGVARAYNPKWSGWKIIDAAKSGPCPRYGTKAYYRYARALNAKLAASSELQALVVKFYHDGIWKEIRGDEIISQYLAYKLFDLATNMGTGTAIILLEKTINDLNGKTPDFPLRGVLTTEMVRWLNEFTAPETLAQGGKSNWRRWCFFAQLKLNALSRYGDLISRNRKLIEFWANWRDRAKYDG